MRRLNSRGKITSFKTCGQRFDLKFIGILNVAREQQHRVTNVDAKKLIKSPWKSDSA